MCAHRSGVRATPATRVPLPSPPLCCVLVTQPLFPRPSLYAFAGMPLAFAAAACQHVASLARALLHGWMDSVWWGRRAQRRARILREGSVGMGSGEPASGQASAARGGERNAARQRPGQRPAMAAGRGGAPAYKHACTRLRTKRQAAAYAGG